MIPRRFPLRLPFYDYTLPASYFITICTKNNLRLFGEIHNGCLQASPQGKFVIDVTQRLPSILPYIEIPIHAIMPNHVHLLLHVNCNQPEGADLTHGLSSVIGTYKSLITRLIHEQTSYTGTVWQRFFHERRIKNERMYWAVWEYIENNPVNWTRDPDHRWLKARFGQ